MFYEAILRAKATENKGLDYILQQKITKPLLLYQYRNYNNQYRNNHVKYK